MTVNKYVINTVLALIAWVFAHSRKGPGSVLNRESMEHHSSCSSQSHGVQTLAVGLSGGCGMPARLLLQSPGKAGGEAASKAGSEMPHCLVQNPAQADIASYTLSRLSHRKERMLGLDWVTFKGLVQPKPLCDCVFRINSQGLKIENPLHVIHTSPSVCPKV